MWGGVLRSIGDTELEVRDELELIRGPEQGEVHVRITATGLCQTDLSAMEGVLPTPVPGLPGHEAAGEVLAVGDGVDGIRRGDHVIVVGIPSCGQCSFCLRGQANLCDQADPFAIQPRHRLDGEDIYPLGNLGTFVEEVILPARGVSVIPDDVPFELAAVIGCGVVTGVGAVLNAAKVEPGASVVVFGCGGVGMSVIQAARVAGAAEIVAVDLVPARLQAAMDLGATHAVSPGEIAKVGDAIHGGRGFDYAFEVVGRPQTIRAAYDSARRGGTVVVVGAGGLDQMVEFSAFELFYQEKALLGTCQGSGVPHRNFDLIIRLWRAGRLDLERLVTRRLKITEINDAIGALRRGEGIRQVVEFT